MKSEDPAAALSGPTLTTAAMSQASTAVPDLTAAARASAGAAVLASAGAATLASAGAAALVSAGAAVQYHGHQEVLAAPQEEVQEWSEDKKDTNRLHI